MLVPDSAVGAKIRWHLHINLTLRTSKNAHATLLLPKGRQYICCRTGCVPYVLWQMAIVHHQRIVLAFVHLHESSSQ